MLRVFTAVSTSSLEKFPTDSLLQKYYFVIVSVLGRIYVLCILLKHRPETIDKSDVAFPVKAWKLDIYYIELQVLSIQRRDIWSSASV